MMREPPVDLSHDALRASLRDQYGLSVADLTFLPLGHDSLAWVFRMRTADDTPYFLKVRRRTITESSLLVPRCLHDQGVTQVIAPLTTTSRALWTEMGGYTLTLYPFVAGAAGKVQGMTPSQWIAFGSILRQIHGATLTPELVRLMPRETFIPAGADLVRDLEARVDEQPLADPAAQTLAVFWQDHRDEIHTLVTRAQDLGRRFAQRAASFVLCHADIHTANVLLDTGGQVWIVDWDETVLAPKERDLMFIAGGGISDRMVGPHEEKLFLQGYGATTLDPLALSYYRYAWAVSEISEFGAQVFFRQDLGRVVRQAEAEEFMSLFLPGQIVAKAFATKSA